MNNIDYGRGQVEWALWRSFTPFKPVSKEIPKVFLTRIKRLLEIDRKTNLDDAEERPGVDYAFAAPASEDTGEIAYTHLDAFCLAIALDLLDIGFKQSEVVFLMYYLRPDLEDLLPTLLNGPSLTDRQRHRAQDNPGYPSYEYRGMDEADGRVFVIIKKMEIKEVSQGLRNWNSKIPLFLEPVYCHGIHELADTFRDLTPYKRRALTVVELASMAQSVAINLEAAPEIRRGRPRS